MNECASSGPGGLFLGRFYFSKWLTFPVLGHKKVLVLLLFVISETYVHLNTAFLQGREIIFQFYYT